MKRLWKQLYKKRMTGIMLLLVIPGIIANWSYAQAPEMNNRNVNQYFNGSVPDEKLGFVWPVDGLITSGFGYRHHPIEGGIRFHSGIDIAAEHGTIICASQSGRVVGAGWHGLLGKCVIIQHDNDFITLYGHCSSVLVQVGQGVERGQVIALVGSTGLATGPHVHFEIRLNGVPVNPMKYLL